METYRIENLSFTYPGKSYKALDNVNIKITCGDFITICGKSGCGKTTLLRLLKTSLAPCGKIEGNILFDDKALDEIDTRTQSSEIGFVSQNPDNQIVTDMVWHELAFGLESLGYSTPEIRSRVAEMASFFGIQTWFNKKVTELSGGQKQLLNLASVMVMHPSVIILDEPTSQLDPIAASEFMNTLSKINQETGTTVILCEHRLEDAISLSDRVIVLDEGKIIVDSSPENAAKILKSINNDMYMAMPVPMRIYGTVEGGDKYPLTVRDGRLWFEQYVKDNTVTCKKAVKKIIEHKSDEAVIQLKDVWYRYEKNTPDILKGLNISVNKGEFFAILGGNGTGKTTMLSLMSGLYKPYRGEVKVFGEKLSEIENLYTDILGVLPQDPKTLFVKKTVKLDLLDILSDKKISVLQKEELIKTVISLCRIEELINNHPYDLSGGEQQRVALAKILLKSPEILILDEPTKGMDAHFKKEFADILSDLKSEGVTIVMVSHDIEFCAENADRCALMFDGNIISSDEPEEFFSGKSFYTTAANRMVRSVFPELILARDVIYACKGNVYATDKHTAETENKKLEFNNKIVESKGQNTNKSFVKITFGAIFLLLFIITTSAQLTDMYIPYFSSLKLTNTIAFQLISIVEITAVLICFLPSGKVSSHKIIHTEFNGNLSKRSIVATFMSLFAVPLTIYIGMVYFNDKKYYFISMIIILETMIPFLVAFENRRPQARELVVISVMCAIAVAGRTAFFMLPQFKPVTALIIITGVCFGSETGFLVGVVTGFVSNFFFGQGPWTQWQMLAWGLIGFISGVFSKTGLLKVNKISLSLFGGIVTFVIYGGIINLSSVFMMESDPSIEMFLSYYVAGAPFDLIHAASTAFFMWFTSETMIEKIERVKTKYGLVGSK